MVNHKKQQAKISQVVCENENFLRTLARTKSTRKQKRLLKYAETKHLLALVEICLNILCSRFHLTTRQRKRLMPHAEFVRKLSRKRSERGARKILLQRGCGAFGLFPALLTPIILELARQTIKSDKNEGTTN